MSKKPKTDRAGVRRRVLLVEPHALTRHAVANTINRCSGLEICGVAGTAAHAFDAVKRLQPDIVVSEIMRPHDLGFIQELHRRHPRLPVLVFSIRDQELYAAPAREAGACGYLMKSAGANQLIRSIRTSLRRWRAAGHGDAADNGANRPSGGHFAARSVKTTG